MIKDYRSVMKEFVDYISQFGNLSKNQIDLMLDKAQIVELKKDEYFSEAGKIPRYVGFVLEGIFRFCYFNNNGEEITNYFIDESSFVADYPKFGAGVAASDYVQAVTDTKFLAFSKSAWEQIDKEVPGWDKIEASIVLKCLNDTIDRRSPLVSKDATTRYLSFIDKFPNVVNRAPLAHIASYLGITQQSLSRIRKNLRGNLVFTKW